MKKFFASLVSLTMTLALFGCGSKPAETPKEDKEVEETVENEDLVSAQIGMDNENGSLLSVEGDSDTSASLAAEQPMVDAATEEIRNTIPKEVDSVLRGLGTDYNKVKWDVEYTLYDDIPGIVCSSAVYNDGISDVVIVAVTNLYDIDVKFSADIIALGAGDKEIGSNFIFEDALGSGSTAVYPIYCDDKASGIVQWDNVDIGESSRSFVPWMLDYSAKQKGSSVQVDYSIYGYDSSVAVPSTAVTFLLLDSSGKVIGHAVDFSSEAAAGKSYKGTATCSSNESTIRKIKSVAVFVNPYK